MTTFEAWAARREVLVGAAGPRHHAGGAGHCDVRLAEGDPAGVRGAVRGLPVRRRHDDISRASPSAGRASRRAGPSPRACWPSSSASPCWPGRTRSARSSCTSSGSGRSSRASPASPAGFRMRQTPGSGWGWFLAWGILAGCLRYRADRQSGRRDPEHPVAGAHLGDHGRHRVHHRQLLRPQGRQRDRQLPRSERSPSTNGPPVSPDGLPPPPGIDRRRPRMRDRGGRSASASGRSSRTCGRSPSPCSCSPCCSWWTVTGTLFEPADPNDAALTALQFGLPAFRDGRWWTIYTGAVTFVDPAFYFFVGAMLGVGLGVYERRVGSLRAATALVVTHTVGIVLPALVLWPFVGSDWAWAAHLRRPARRGTVRRRLRRGRRPLPRS